MRVIIQAIILGLTIAACITCIVMTVVFCFDISLVYPQPIVNVRALTFYMRCDQVSGGSPLLALVVACNATSFVVQPTCNNPGLQGYVRQAYGYGVLDQCPTGYLQRINDTVNLDANLVLLAVILMGLGIVLVWIPFFVLWGMGKIK